MLRQSEDWIFTWIKLVISYRSNIGYWIMDWKSSCWPIPRNTVENHCFIPTLLKIIVSLMIWNLRRSVCWWWLLPKVIDSDKGWTCDTAKTPYSRNDHLTMNYRDVTLYGALAPFLSQNCRYFWFRISETSERAGYSKGTPWEPHSQRVPLENGATGERWSDTQLVTDTKINRQTEQSGNPRYRS